jgi:glycosyltransferase involved in cell wall biosynthesis
MNIALFASAFYPSLGGVEELCRQLALELLRQGHGVIVLTNRWPRDLPATETLDGVPVYRLPFRLPEGSAKAAINYHLTHHRIEREMLGILRSHKIDLLHVQCVSSNAHYAMIAQEKLELPLVVTLQGELTMDANQIFQKSPQAREILRQSLDQADVITACSGKTLRDGEEFYGKPFGDRGRVIFNGVNLAEFGASMNTDHGSRTKTDVKPASLLAAAPDTPASRQVDPAGPAAADEALPKILISEQCSMVSERVAARGRYIFALGRMAKQKGFDVLIRAYALLAAASREQRASSSSHLASIGEQAPPSEQNRSEALPPNAGCEMRDASCRTAPALPENSRFQVPGSDSSSTAATEPVTCNPSPVTSAISVTSVCSVATTCLPTLVIAGDGPELEPLKTLVRDLGLADCVHFPGRADRQQVAAYMTGCEFFVISSPAEPFGIVILEAIAAGAAVIAINNAGPAEIITQGVDGLLVDRSEPELLAAAMCKLLSDSDLRRRLSAAGRQRAADFSWPKIAQQYVAAYGDAASNEQ